MKHSHLGLIALLLSLALACNKPTPAAAPDPQPPVGSGQDTPPKPSNPAAGEPVKAVLEQVIALAKQGDCAALAPFLVLRHTDAADDWKRSLRYDTPAERVMADKECARLQVLFTDLKAHTYQDFAQEDESEGQWNIWTLDLQYNDGSSEAHAFAFLPLGNSYVLGDID
jgi:hypothetical protein